MPSFSTQSAIQMHNHQEVQNLIRENKLKEAILHLKTHITDADRDTLTLLERDDQDLASTLIKGLISEDEAGRKKRQLADRILAFSRTIKEERSPQTLVSQRPVPASLAQNQTPLSLKAEPKTLASMPQPQPKTITIFLACSHELEKDRNDLQTYLLQQNNTAHFCDHNLRIDPKSWEDLPQGLRGTDRTQDNYNNFISTCDAVIMLYWTKVGSFTNEELDLAMRISAKPNAKTTTYICKCDRPVKPSEVDHTSLADFEQKFSTVFPISYESTNDLKLRFSDIELPSLVKLFLKAGN